MKLPMGLVPGKDSLPGIYGLASPFLSEETETKIGCTGKFWCLCLFCQIGTHPYDFIYLCFPPQSPIQSHWGLRLGHELGEHTIWSTTQGLTTYLSSHKTGEMLFKLQCVALHPGPVTLNKLLEKELYKAISDANPSCSQGVWSIMNVVSISHIEKISLLSKAWEMCMKLKSCYGAPTLESLGVKPVLPVNPSGF